MIENELPGYRSFPQSPRGRNAWAMETEELMFDRS
jgi:hypothetical protein